MATLRPSFSAVLLQVPSWWTGFESSSRRDTRHENRSIRPLVMLAVEDNCQDRLVPLLIHAHLPHVHGFDREAHTNHVASAARGVSGCEVDLIQLTARVLAGGAGD